MTDMKYLESAENQISFLVKITRLNIKDWESAETDRFIYLGELELALDGTAFAYVERDLTVAPDVKNVMASLANEMKMLDDPEWDSVRKILISK